MFGEFYIPLLATLAHSKLHALGILSRLWSSVACTLDVLEHLAPARKLCSADSTPSGAALNLLPLALALFTALLPLALRWWHLRRGLGRLSGAFSPPPALLGRLPGFLICAKFPATDLQVVSALEVRQMCRHGESFGAPSPECTPSPL